MLKGSGKFPPNTGHYLSHGCSGGEVPKEDGEKEVTRSERSQHHRPWTVSKVEVVDKVRLLDCKEQHGSMASEYVKDRVSGRM